MDIEGFSQVLKENPDLTIQGMETPRWRLQMRKAEKSGPPSFEGVQLCVEWLLRHDAFNRRKTINPKRTSYGWKHVVERSAGKYVSNGEFICAALYLKYKIKRDGVGPNVYLNIRNFKE